MTLGEAAVMEQSFESLNDAITYAFRQEQKSLLSLDRICEVLQSPNLFFNSKKQGLLPCSSITRRRISSALSSCELFVRAGPPRTCLWAIRPHNPLFLSDGVISSSIEQMLTANGPMTVDQFVNATQLAGADATLYSRFLSEHAFEFTGDEDGTYWFTGQPRPVHRDFESISHALVCAFADFPQGASVEELHWCLCLSTVGGTKSITRRCVSRELSRRQDLFSHLSRARYTLLSNVENAQPGVQQNNGNSMNNNMNINNMAINSINNMNNMNNMSNIPNMSVNTMNMQHTPNINDINNMNNMSNMNNMNNMSNMNNMNNMQNMNNMNGNMNGMNNMNINIMPNMNNLNNMEHLPTPINMTEINNMNNLMHMPQYRQQQMVSSPQQFPFFEIPAIPDDMPHNAQPNDEDPFDPTNFFGNDFSFSFD